MLCLTVFAVESIGIGRFDPSMLSDQDRFELFMTFDNPDDISEELHGDPLDHCSWSGVTCDEGNIISIEWVSPYEEVKGEINMSMVPSHMELLLLERQQIRGDADLTHLPDTMKILRIIGCQLTGTLSFHSLPPKIEKVSFCYNRIEEISNFGNLPERIVEIELFEDYAELKDVDKSFLPKCVLILNQVD